MGNKEKNLGMKVKIKKALVSLSDKENLTSLLKILQKYKWIWI